MRALSLTATLLVAFAAATAALCSDAWCSVVFKDAALEADAVVLARVERPRNEPPRVNVVDVLKGEYDLDFLSLPTAELEDHDLKHEDHVLLALDGERRVLRQSRSLGLCDVISILPIRRGRLRARDRAQYDSLDGTMTLDQLTEELRRDLEAPSRRAGVSHD